MTVGGGGGNGTATNKPTGGSNSTNTTTKDTNGNNGTTNNDDEQPGATATKTTEQPAATGGGSDDQTNLSDFAQKCLKAHNDFRATHSAPALVWNDTLAKGAEQWTAECIWEHSGDKILGGNHGENLQSSVSKLSHSDHS